MRDIPLPPFRNIAGRLFVIILTVALIPQVLPWAARGVILAWVILAAFILVILAMLLCLTHCLFPSRQPRCMGSAIIKRVVEIEEVP